MSSKSLEIPRVPFYFVRHGQTDWNVEGRMQGHTDIPLNEKGIHQAHSASEKLRSCDFDVIVASPLIRAARTAEIINQVANVPIHFDDELRERSFGSFEGKITSEMKALHGLKPEDSITLILPFDAEHWPQTMTRVIGVRRKWLMRLEGKTILFCDHGANFRATYEHTHGERLEAKNAVPYLFTPTVSGWEMREV